MVIRLQFKDDKCVGYITYTGEIYPYIEQEDVVMRESSESEVIDLFGGDWRNIIIHSSISKFDPIEPPVDPVTPTEGDALRQEIKLLRGQVSASADIAEFHEELIAELATMVYQ